MGRRKKVSSDSCSTNSNNVNGASTIPKNNDVNKKSKKKHNENNDSQQRSPTQQLKISKLILNLSRERKINEKENTLKDTDVNKTPNAFKLMMDNRHKSIGQNADGISLNHSDSSNLASTLENVEDNTKIMQREKFNVWAQSKVSVKRKLREEEDEARDLFISETMTKRSRRLRKMLNINLKEDLLDDVNDDDGSDLDFSPYRSDGKKIKRHKKGKRENKLTNKHQKKSKALTRKVSEEVIILSDNEAVKIKPKSAVKLAPIFAKTIPRIDAVDLEAKKSFLQSDLPNSLKKKFERTNSADLGNDVAQFPVTCHVQQRDDNKLWNLSRQELTFKEKASVNEPFQDIIRMDSNMKLLGMMKPIEVNTNAVVKEFATIQNLCDTVKKIKMENPHYPVLKAFKSLCEITGYNTKIKPKRKSNNGVIERRNYTTWTEKYKAKCSHDFVGNATNILELKKWLSNWTNNTKNETRLNNLSDFDSDSDSISDRLSNGMILIGPHGTGKTASVYAVSKELGYNVIELNASSKRTGKKLIQELLEATQSHQIHKHDGKSLVSNLSRENDINNLKIKDSKLCLLLVDDVDVIFEQDEGFIYSLTQLLLTSKRPIIMTATDRNTSYMQRYINQYPKLYFKELSVKKQSVWLKVLCAMEGLLVDVRSLDELLEWNNGDMRKTISHLQFWLLSGGNCLHKDFNMSDDKAVMDIEVDDDDENDLLSNAKVNKRNSTCAEKHHGDCLRTFHPIVSSISHPIDLDNYHLNVRDAIFKTANLTKFSLSNYANLTNNLRMCDLFYKNSANNITNGSIVDSLELKERAEYYDENDVISEEITRFILESNLNHFLDEETFNWSFKRSVINRPIYEEEVQKCLPLTLTLDYDNFHLDYCSAIRNIARNEVHRSQNSFKRTNRFYNYLNNLDINCNSSLLQSLSDSLNLQNNL